jgi:hypothetical protein
MSVRMESLPEQMSQKTGDQNRGRYLTRADELSYCREETSSGVTIDAWDFAA